MICVIIRNPVSKVFTTVYPQPMVLGAGNSFILPITFHPLEKVPYEDQIEFISTVSWLSEVVYSM